jgi:hypothetical protein
MNDGGAVIGPLLMVVLLAGGIALWVHGVRGMRSRTIETALSPEEVRQLFRQAVVTWSWNVEDDGNPLVARSSLLTGLYRQRIALRVQPGEPTTAEVYVVTYDGQLLLPIPKRPHAVAWRIGSFVDAVRSADPGARVT